MWKAISTLLVMCAVGAPLMATETPGFRVVEEHGAVQVRDYDALVVVETVVDAAFEDAGGIAFRRLFDYISGANEARRKIAMTAPVIQEPAALETASPAVLDNGGEGWRIAFLLPSDIAWEDAPVPRDGRVELRRIPPRRLAAIRFSGAWSEERFEVHHRRLAQLIADRGWRIVGEPVYARYNAPFTPSFMRRNEVLIPIAAVDPS